jgi:hypothetical protein
MGWCVEGWTPKMLRVLVVLWRLGRLKYFSIEAVRFRLETQFGERLSYKSVQYTLEYLNETTLFVESQEARLGGGKTTCLFHDYRISKRGQKLVGPIWEVFCRGVKQ